MSDSTAGHPKAPLLTRDRQSSQRSAQRSGAHAGRGRRGARGGDPEVFLARCFRRIDKRVAASFTAEQRAAIQTMFGDRWTVRHPVDIRASFPLGRRRFYLVFLLGRDRRRRFRGATDERRFLSELLGYGLLAAGILLPLFALALALRPW